MSSPYIGITDFADIQQVRNVLRRCGGPLYKSGRKLHVGVMMSYKTLNDMPTRWAALWAKKQELPGIFQADPLVYNVLHYADYSNIDVLASLRKARNYCGPHLNAIQLDMTLPPVEDVREFVQLEWRTVEIILQIGPETIKRVKDETNYLLDCLSVYMEDHSIAHVLFDMSRGRGHQLKVAPALRYLRAIRESYPKLGLVVAGDLHSGSLHELAPAFREFPDLSIDSQTRMHKHGNLHEPLNEEENVAYIIKACKLVACT